MHAVHRVLLLLLFQSPGRDLDTPFVCQIRLMGSCCERLRSLGAIKAPIVGPDKAGRVCICCSVARPRSAALLTLLSASLPPPPCPVQAPLSS
jgi:hypothetical protein